MMLEIKKVLKFVNEVLHYPEVHILASPSDAEVVVDGRKKLMFGSYNYLGLANNLDVKQAAIETTKQYGVGTGGVRILTGTMDIHVQLEKKVARLTNQEDAMTIASGYGTNVGVVPGLVNLLGFSSVIQARKAVIFNDEYNHASLVDGSRLSDAVIEKYKHGNTDDLEAKLIKYPKYRKLIITDGIFSMDGDIAPLKDIIRLARKYEALTMVDDAHAFGVVGKNGAGSVSMLGCEGQIDINMGTFSKGIGVSGGFISGKKEMIDYLRLSTRSYMFSDSLSPMIVGAVSAAIDFIQAHPNRLTELAEKSAYFRNGLQDMGLSTLNSCTHIVPLLTGDNENTIKFTKELYNCGIIAPAVRWPAVPKELGRIRFALSAAHTEEQINRVLEAVRDITEKIPIPKIETPLNSSLS